jgi:sulfatase modifying factor 1
MRAQTAVVVTALLVAASANGENAASVTPMVNIPAGPWIRCASCTPESRRVTIELSAFRIDQDEVTRAQYAECAKAKKCAAPRIKGKSDNLDQPVRAVTWFDADAYCKFVGKRLPTEAEWDRVAFPSVKSNLNGPTAPRIGSHDLCRELDILGYNQHKCQGHSASLGVSNVMLAEMKLGNYGSVDKGSDWGDRVVPSPGVEVYDVYGNVAEWVFDWDGMPSDSEYYFHPKTTLNPQGPAKGDSKVVVGGSFMTMNAPVEGVSRTEAPSEHVQDVGFRCARSID